MLMGLVAKNGILLIDFVNQARREGMDRPSCLESCRPSAFTPHFNDQFGNDFWHICPWHFPRASEQN